MLFVRLGKILYTVAKRHDPFLFAVQTNRQDETVSQQEPPVVYGIERWNPVT